METLKYYFSWGYSDSNSQNKHSSVCFSNCKTIEQKDTLLNIFEKRNPGWIITFVYDPRNKSQYNFICDPNTSFGYLSNRIQKRILENSEEKQNNKHFRLHIEVEKILRHDSDTGTTESVNVSPLDHDKMRSIYNEYNSFDKMLYLNVNIIPTK